jgi:hypothetical protein
MAILGKCVATTSDTHVYTVPANRRSIVLINATNTHNDYVECDISIRADVDFEVGSILIDNAGDNFIAKPDLLFDEATGDQPVQATAVVTTMAIKSTAFTGTETGYNIGDVLTASDPSNFSVELDAPMEITVTSVDGGTGSIVSFIISDEGIYNDVIPLSDSITLSGGTGVGATLDLSATNYGILSTSVTNSGDDYLVTPVIIAVETGTDTPIGNATLTSQMVSDAIRRYDAIEYETQIPAGSALERSAIVLGEGDSIYAKSNTEDVLNIMVFGVEEIA